MKIFYVMIVSYNYILRDINFATQEKIDPTFTRTEFFRQSFYETRYLVCFTEHQR